jgi:predicted lactoylglutathione lyase
VTAAPQLRTVAPVLLVADVAKAADYFSKALGFCVPRMWGDPPHFCIPYRDGIEVMLNQIGSGDPVRPNAELNGRFDAYFSVSDADALYAEFRANGANVICEPQDHDYGMREFQVLDVDGHLLAFGEMIEEAA